MAFGRIIVLVAVLASVAVIARPAAAQTGQAPATIQQLVADYAAAWGSRDPDRIAALHTPDTVFDLRIAGETPQNGRQAVRERFGGILRDNPGYASTVTKVGFGPDFVVIEYKIAMAPPAPFVLGRVRYSPTTAPYALPAIDVIRFRDGLVSEKVTFLDVDTIRTNSQAADAVQAIK
jgi:uncharacterized protein (TIGR02246 family)